VSKENLINNLRLSRATAKMTGGRWNSKGTPVVYYATSIALAPPLRVQKRRHASTRRY
jgi:RES domain-containing protein